jgi:nitroimidazol reductase NimA-like FMN-containing flavoprotein (pyridoxamine 5'-phosphate oxidase superfamily)
MMKPRALVLAFDWLFLTHAALAPATNQMSGCERAVSAPRFFMRCTVSEAFTPSESTRVVREPQRGVYDRETIYEILDEGLVCHVGFSADGQPFVIPTLYARIGDAIYFHGSAASRMLRGVSEGSNVCLTVTLTDGIVLARSVFNHSMNYRSVVALGKATLVDAPQEKLEALRAFTEKILPHRWDDARQPNEKELKATSVLRLPLTEASAKVRVGPPEDDAPDYALPVWAGVIPLHTVAGAPIRDERCDLGIPLPVYASNYKR